MTFALRDAGPEDGGFACVPGSHKSKYRMPETVRTFEDEVGIVAKPDVRAGDAIFFMDGAQSHGARAWQSQNQRRAILLKYASRSTTRSGVSASFIEPESYWGEETVRGMTPEQRGVMFGPASGARRTDYWLDVDRRGIVHTHPVR